MYIQEAGEGTSPTLSFLHPFVMICNKKLSAESNIWYASHNFPAPDINEANKCIMHTSIGAKLFICKLDYCLKVDEPSPNAKKMGYVYVFDLNFK